MESNYKYDSTLSIGKQIPPSRPIHLVMLYISTWNRSTRHAPLSSTTKTSRAPKHGSRLGTVLSTRRASHVSHRTEIDATRSSRDRGHRCVIRAARRIGAQYVMHASHAVTTAGQVRRKREHGTACVADRAIRSPVTSRGGTIMTRNRITTVTVVVSNSCRLTKCVRRVHLVTVGRSRSMNIHSIAETPCARRRHGTCIVA